MPEPVKLSRERWASLCRATPMIVGGFDLLSGKPQTETLHYVDRDSITISEPREIDGITFLPAEYVPADDGSHVEYRFRNGSSIAVG